MEKIIYLERSDEADVDPRASEDERVEAAVRWINRKVESTVHFGLVQIGYYLLRSFFQDDVQQALSRNPHKPNSFRKLCQRGDLLISSTHLVNAVKLVVQERQMGTDPAFRQLAVSHKIALLAVPDLREKRALARQAVADRLSVRALARRVQKARAVRSVDADAWSRRVRRALASAHRLLAEPVLDGLSAAEQAQLDAALLEGRRQLQATLADLRGLRSVAV